MVVGASGVGTSLLYLSPSMIATVVSFAVGVHLFDRSRLGDAMRSFSVALIAEAAWSAAIVGELASTSLDGKIFWDAIQLPPLFVTSLALFEFSRRYTGRPPVRLWPGLALLSVVPFLTTLFVFTEPLHHRARIEAQIIEVSPFSSLVYPFTTIELLGLGECIVLALTATVLMLRHLVSQPREFRFQAAVLTFAVTSPLVSAYLLVSNVLVFGQRDSTPIVFGATALVVAFGLSRRATFELLPVAREVVVEHIPDGVLVLGDDERIVDANPSAKRLLGDDLLRRSLADVFPELDLPPRTMRVEGSVVQVVVVRDHREKAFDVRVASFGPSGGRVLVLTDVTARVVAERDARGIRDHLETRVAERTSDLARVNEALSREIEERTHAQEALAQSEQRFRAVFDQTFQFIGVLALDGTVLRANATALEFAGVTAEEIEGIPFWDTAFWSHSPELQQRIKQAIHDAAGGRTVRFEATHPDRFGVEHVIDFSVKPVVGPDGKPVLLVPEGRDVTDNKRAEEARAQLEVQLHQAQKMESLGRLAGGIAHDFNNLLTAILGNASLILRKTPADGVAAAFANDILRAGESAAELTKQLLAFSRRQMIERRVEDLGDLVTGAVRLLNRVVGDDVEVVTELRAQGARAVVDAGQIEQAIVNLAVNARDAMPEGGRLRLVVDVAPLRADERERLGLAESVDEVVTLDVVDDGTGMPPELLARIFEPFFTTKPLGRGTGLGLAMVFGAMRQNEGAIDVRSQPGVGTTFTLYFPRTQEVGRARRRASIGAQGGAERIVVVEDQPLVRELTARWLVELGYRVRAFANADDALAAVAPEECVDLLLTDVVLPGMSGRLLAEKFQESRTSMRVLFMSGYNDDVALERTGSVSGVMMLSKPFTAEQLASAVRYRLLPTSGEVRLASEPVVDPGVSGEGPAARDVDDIRSR